uniref:BTB domain-containing protein n=1 Tax=Meloidogyne hapla TaxID=6305 RepID=A0A1I8BH80_MELHA
MFEQETLTDCVIKIDNQEINAHRCILAQNSEVFLRMFEQDGMIEAQNGEINIVDSSYECFRAMLKYFYSGEVEKNASNFTKRYFYAEIHELPMVKKACLDFLSANRKKFLASKEWEEFKADNKEKADQMLIALVYDGDSFLFFNCFLLNIQSFHQYGLEECGKSRACWPYPPGCNSVDTCQAAKPIINSNEPQWMAMAFSDDMSMGNDSVMDCLFIGNNKPEMEISYNLFTQNIPLNKILKLDNSNWWHILYAQGPAYESGVKQFHTIYQKTDQLIKICDDCTDKYTVIEQ